MILRSSFLIKLANGLEQVHVFRGYLPVDSLYRLNIVVASLLSFSPLLVERPIGGLLMIGLADVLAIGVNSDCVWLLGHTRLWSNGSACYKPFLAAWYYPSQSETAELTLPMGKGLKRMTILSDG